MFDKNGSISLNEVVDHLGSKLDNGTAAATNVAKNVSWFAEFDRSGNNQIEPEGFDRLLIGGKSEYSLKAIEMVSKVFKLFILNAIVRFSLAENETLCFAGIQYNDNQYNDKELPLYFDVIFEKSGKFKKMLNNQTLETCDDNVLECVTKYCTEDDGYDVFRINGCGIANGTTDDRHPTDECSKYSAFDEMCDTKNGQILKCNHTTGTKSNSARLKLNVKPGNCTTRPNRLKSCADAVPLSVTLSFMLLLLLLLGVLSIHL
uniref:EF-hand domain-containing protein n=1 Tax=Globodera rostochiensis TaxID=31243 RepID=A0A914H9Y9_GLORO